MNPKIKVMNLNYQENPEQDDEFSKRALDADYNLSFLSETFARMPVVSQSTKENLNYVQSYCKEAIVGPDFYTRRKNLKSYTMIYTYSGQGELMLRSKRYVLRAGDCCFLNCEEAHEYRTLSKEGWKITQVHFYGEKIHYIYGIWAAYHRPVVNVGGHPTFQSTLDALGDSCSRSTISYTLAVDCNISYLLSILVNACVYQDERNYPRRIKGICEYIDTHYGASLTLEAIAEQHFISKCYLSREFKKYTGQTLMEYLRNVRLSQAKVLLLTSELTIAEIARAVGFEYASYFQNVFKKQEGITPIQYRKQWRD